MLIHGGNSLAVILCFFLLYLCGVCPSDTMYVHPSITELTGVQSFVHNGLIKRGSNTFRRERRSKVFAENDKDEDEEIDDLVIPNPYYKRSKYSKVGFKEGLRKEVESQQERLARTFNIMAPMPKEALVTPRDNDIDPSLVANFEKYLKKRLADDEEKSKSSSNNQSSKKQEKPPKVPKASVPPRKPEKVVRCPNAIILDKSVIFSTPLDEYIVVGKILRPHGLKGHVKVQALCKNPEVRLCEPGYRFLKFPNRDGTVMPIKIEYGRLLDGINSYRLKLEGVDTKDQALRLNGSYLSVSIRDVPPLEEDCYYSRDLLNLDIYLFNDASKTRLGKVVDFRHREDLVSMPKLANLTEDLIEVEMDISLSLKTLKALTERCKEAAEMAQEAQTAAKPKGVSVVTEHDLETADEVIDAEEELINSSMTGVQYVKYYVCSICNKEFTNYGVALKHDRAHEAGVLQDATEPAVASPADDPDNADERIYTIDEYYEKKIKRPVRRFYIPLIKEETIKFVDIPNKSLYVETFTIFLGEDGNKTTV
ncbi:16S rRNA processing protein RimM domain containing protein [Babesia divergens]|uniref:16S rRNA processing protein RimM domain containing protein n=1 Tax=Babesia divergens TaxID=32595 RepID=A0AAD9LEB7_BABDI|nr:16S rRNA processing protein RimM domain containing protein [Babesia divergens]